MWLSLWQGWSLPDPLLAPALQDAAPGSSSQHDQRTEATLGLGGRLREAVFQGLVSPWLSVSTDSLVSFDCCLKVWQCCGQQ